VTDAIAYLTHDHDEVKAMLTRLESMPSASTGASKEQLEERKTIVEQLVIELSKHEAVEEEYFWPTVRESLASGDMMADKALRQEQEGKEALDKLCGMSPDNLDFERTLTSTRQDLLEHIRTEEEVFAALQGSCSQKQLDELGEKLEKAKKMAPTRPHPHAPNSATGVKMAGAVAAPLDKMRDAATGRGK
jgi:hypothetical protein